jgi:hypothetical protein
MPATNAPHAPHSSPEDRDEIRPVDTDDDDVDDVDDVVSIDGDIPGMHEDMGEQFSDAIDLLAESLATADGVGLADIMMGMAESLSSIAEGIERHNKLMFKMSKSMEK